MNKELTEYMIKQREEAIKDGWGKYDRPAEAKICGENRLFYNGKRCGYTFMGIPYKDLTKEE